jgi:hypothetical protein
VKRFVTGQARGQATLLPERLEDFLAEDNPVWVIDAFVEQLDLRAVGFAAVDPKATGRPADHPAVLLKLYICGYLNRVQSSPLTPKVTPCLQRRVESCPKHSHATPKADAGETIGCRLGHRRRTSERRAGDSAHAWRAYPGCRTR